MVIWFYCHHWFGNCDITKHSSFGNLGKRLSATYHFLSMTQAVIWFSALPKFDCFLYQLWLSAIPNSLPSLTKSHDLIISSPNLLPIFGKEIFVVPPRDWLRFLLTWNNKHLHILLYLTLYHFSLQYVNSNLKTFFWVRQVTWISTHVSLSSITESQQISIVICQWGSYKDLKSMKN